MDKINNSPVREELWQELRCDVCGFLVLEYTADSVGKVRGKCKKCKKIVPKRMLPKSDGKV